MFAFILNNQSILKQKKLAAEVPKFKRQGSLDSWLTNESNESNNSNNSNDIFVPQVTQQMLHRTDSCSRKWILAARDDTRITRDVRLVQRSFATKTNNAIIDSIIDAMPTVGIRINQALEACRSAPRMFNMFPETLHKINKIQEKLVEYAAQSPPVSNGLVENLVKELGDLGVHIDETKTTSSMSQEELDEIRADSHIMTNREIRAQLRWTSTVRE